MRNIELIVIHCSATREDRRYTLMQLLRDHRTRFGFTGYHYYVERDGTVTQTRHEQLPGAHVAGYNQHSLGVCYEGGLDRNGKPCDTRTAAQRRALRELIDRLKQRHPEATVVGHRDLPGVHKDCPCFDATAAYAD